MSTDGMPGASLHSCRAPREFSRAEAQSILASRRKGSALSQRSMTHFFKVSLWLGYLKCSRSLREALFLNSHVPASARLVPGFLLKFSAQLLSVARQVGHQARNKGPCVAAAQLCRGSERGASSPSGPAQGTPKWETAFTADVRVNVLSFCTYCSGTFAELIYASDLVSRQTDRQTERQTDRWIAKLVFLVSSARRR